MISKVTVKGDRVAGSEEVVIVPLYAGSGRLADGPSRLDRSVGGAITDARRDRGFSGARGASFLITVRRINRPAHILLLGLGEKKKCDPEVIAHAAGVAARSLNRSRFRSAALLLDHATGEPREEFARAFVKGFGLALYDFRVGAKPAPEPRMRRLSILTSSNRRVIGAAVTTAGITVEHTEIVRDLVNAPAGDLSPDRLARRARALCREHGVSCRIISRAEMEKAKMGAVLAVGQGSTEEPKFVVMHYNKGRKLPLVCLIGKGVTFDSGGISIKPWQRMNEMKGDMAGAALAISVISAAARLALSLEIVAITPLVENMPDGKAFRPGDVIRTYSGKTIEVFSTDAEGRLILADAITYVRKHYDPVVTIDFATLTGAVIIALGTRISGVMGNSQKHIDALIRAGKAAGEPAWQLPLDDHFYDAVRGDISDFKNYTGRDGSTSTAAALLGKFAGEEPWVHVDIAGTFWSEGRGASYNRKGATGYGVDLTLRYLEGLVGSES